MKIPGKRIRALGENVNGLLLVVLLAAAVVAVHAPGKATETSGAGANLRGFPMTLGEWTATEIELSAEAVASLGADDYLLREYRSGGEPLTLYITYFGTGNGALTHNPEKCYTASGWTLLDKRVLELPGSGRQVLLSTAVRGDRRQRILYWYQDRDRVIVSKTDHVVSVLSRALLGGKTQSFVASIGHMTASAGHADPAEPHLGFAELVMDALAKQKER
jgi:EpsI family protein